MSSSLFSLLVCCALGATPVDGNRLAYLDGHDIYYPHTKFPKLVTPQWVGEEGVDAVVILAIDDMRDTAKYEAYLRPILQRLKQIDGRAPVSIMTCNVKPDDPQLQTWLQEGLSLEVHTFDHPCPLLQGSLDKAKGTYDRCVDLLFSIPNNTPVAYRMPCCDSLNTVSPRFYKEIFNKTTPGGKFLQISSSVFQVYTADDPEIPRELLFDADGKERFRKYFPKGLKRGETTHDRFLNYVENYPYPYIIDGMCWEFPCMTPSDWEANFLHQPNNPQTVADMKAALDITVLKQGVLNLVFHPHGWIQAEQINELIDHAVTKHGKKVKFLTFKEALERLNKNVLAGRRLRDPQGGDAGVRLLDIDGDTDLDVLISNEQDRLTRIWDSRANRWTDHPTPFALVMKNPADGKVYSGQLHTQFATAGVTFQPPVMPFTQWDWSKDAWQKFQRNKPWQPKSPWEPMSSRVFRDINGDGLIDTLFGSYMAFGNLIEIPGFPPRPGPPWPSELPRQVGPAIRFLDLDDNWTLDIVHSDAEAYSVHLWTSREVGWTLVLSGRRGEKPADQELPPIVRADGTDNGFFVRDRGLHWINEDTAHLPNLAVSWDFDKLLGDRPPAPKTPRAAVESMRVRPGFSIELMAHEPDVIDPVAFQWGPDGKLWVVEMADYPSGMDGRGAPGGRVRFLEDTKGDGQYDKSTLFLDKVPFPNGVHPWKNGVLVSAAPDIFFAADTDGDGKADVREVLFTGFGEGNQQHRVNGFTWGLDGWLYLANGDSGGQITSKKTGKTLDLRGRDLRIRPETGEMEAVNGQTQFGRARDDWGHWFGNNNSRPLWQYVLEDRYLSRNPHLPVSDTRRDVSNQPGNAPVFPASKTLTRFNDFHTANRFTSACSAIVEGEGLMAQGLGLRDREQRNPIDNTTSASVPQPLALSPQLSFVSEPVHNLVHCEMMGRDGVRATSQRLPDEQQSEFLASTDNWFRPTQLKVGPDGALWIADMYRLVIEHPQWIPQEWQEKLNVRAGEDKGRLWRLFPTGTQLRPAPRLDKLSTVELIAAMDSPNRWQRDLAQQLIIEHCTGDAAAARALGDISQRLDVLVHRSQHPPVRLQALATLGILQSLNATSISTALQDEHPGVRAQAVRLSESLATQDDALLRQIANRVTDTDPWVQLQLAATLGELPGDLAADALARLIQANEDPYVRALALSSLNTKNLPAVVHAVLKSSAVQTDGHPLIAPLLTYAVAVNEFDTLEELAAVILSSDPAAAQPWQWAAVETWLTAQRRQNRPWADWLQTTKSEHPALAAHWSRWLTQFRPLIDHKEIPPERRAAALRLFSQIAIEPEFSADWLKPNQPLEVQRAAIEFAGRMQSSTAAEQIVSEWPKLSPTLRATAREQLLGRVAVAAALLKAVGGETLSPTDIDPETDQFLRAHRDTSIRQDAERWLKRTDVAHRGEIVTNYLRTMPATGDAAAGRELFAKRCAQCHKLGELGHAVGPDLASLTDKSVSAIVTAVLDPNRAVEAKFLQFNAATTAGQTVSGLLSHESATSVTLLAAEAKSKTLLRSEIDELWAINKSLMPEGLEKELTPVALADVASFIRANVALPARKTFAGNEPQTVLPNAAGRFELTPTTAEVYGPTIVIEAKHGNLGWWSSAEDSVVWTVDVPARGDYRVELEWACDAAAAGHRLMIQGGQSPLVHQVAATAGWDDYQAKSIGTIELESGPRRLTIRPVGRPLPALMDLRKVVLVPIPKP
jgi:putative membrane-bound dehydrogenase-like protein